MNPDILQFQCGFCHTLLTVPAQMAGVSGPCPSCGQTVTSPLPAVSQAPPQWNQVLTAEQAPAVPPAWSPPPQSPVMDDLEGAGVTSSTPSTGLPPKRALGQPPVTATLGGSGQMPWASVPLPGMPTPGSIDPPGAASSSGVMPNHSRLIPGAPALSNLMPTGNTSLGGMTGMPSGASLLGREIPAAPISPVTLPMSAGGAPSLNLGGAGQSSATAPMPAGRHLTNMRTPRGTNFIRLAFAAVFLLGFLGLVGLLLKDYLPDVFPNLAVLDEVEAGDTAETRTPATTTGSPSATPLISHTTTAEISPPPSSSSSAEADSKPPLMIGGFDPTETTPSKAQPGIPPEISTVVSTSSANLPLTSATPVEAAPGNSSSSGTLLEVPPSSSAIVASSAPMSEPSAGLMQTDTIAEDDAPPEAKPAVEALKKFLSANSLAERLPYTLGVELMQPLMERYYKHSSAGPVVVDRIQFVRMDPNPELGSGKHCIFSLENKTWEFPVPVMLEEQPDGFKVDWLAFVEFKDRLLEKFFQTYQEGPAGFHVGIIRHHYFEDGVPNLDRKDSFRISPAPPNSFQASVFLDKDSPLAQELRVRLPWETHVWAVVELEWKKLGSQQWVELSAVPQLHWYSLPAGPRPISTPQKAKESESMPPGISKNGVGSKSGSNMPPPGIKKSDPSLPPTVRRPLPAGR